MKRIIVTNTGPVLHLTEAKGIGYLRQAGDIFTPNSVIAEMRLLIPGWRCPAWLKITALTDQAAMDALSWRQAGLLDEGESDAIALAQSLRADWFLTDDAAARLFAQVIGI